MAMRTSGDDLSCVGREDVLQSRRAVEDLLVDGRADRAIVVGGSGQGEVIACNKIVGIRAGLCPDVWSATISRGNNDANVLVLGVKVVDPDLAEQIVAAWFGTDFKGGVHQRRIDMIAAIERGEPLT